MPKANHAYSPTNRVKDLDTTRPVTAAQSGGQFNPVNVSQAVDVVGFNYQQYDYDKFHRQNPTMKMTSSEDVSGLMERGVYVTDKSKNLIDAYDLQNPGWGAIHRTAWKAIDERPFVAGCFIWTGFDYHGEPTPYAWPTIGSFFGIMDMCGFPKTVYYYYQSWWTDKDVLHIAPHWNWKGREGQPIPVWVNSNADNVELMLNGKSLGKKEMPRNGHLEWIVNYAPGKLEAVGYKKGRKLSAMVQTTGEPYRIVVQAAKNSLTPDGKDAAVFNITVVDKQGLQVPDASNLLHFSLTGNAHIIGVGNGDPSSHEPDKYTTGGWQRSLFSGKCQVIIQSDAVGQRSGVNGQPAGISGDVQFRAEGEGLQAGTATLHRAL